MRVPYETMLAEFERVLKKYGFSANRAHDAAETDAIVDTIAADVASSQPVIEGGRGALPRHGGAPQPEGESGAWHPRGGHQVDRTPVAVTSAFFTFCRSFV